MIPRMLHPAAVKANGKQLMLNGFSAEFLNIPGCGVGAQIGVVNVRSKRRFRRIRHESAGQEVLDHLALLLQLVHGGV